MQYRSGAVQDRAGSPGGLTSGQRFCAAKKMDMLLYVTEVMVAVTVAREHVPLLDENIGAIILSLDLFSMQSSRSTLVVGEILDLPCRYNALSASHCMENNNPFTNKPSVWTDQNASSQTCSLFATMLGYAPSLLCNLQCR